MVAACAAIPRAAAASRSPRRSKIPNYLTARPTLSIFGKRRASTKRLSNIALVLPEKKEKKEKELNISSDLMRVKSSQGRRAPRPRHALTMHRTPAADEPTTASTPWPPRDRDSDRGSEDGTAFLVNRISVRDRADCYRAQCFVAQVSRRQVEELTLRKRSTRSSRLRSRRPDRRVPRIGEASIRQRTPRALRETIHPLNALVDHLRARVPLNEVSPLRATPMMFWTWCAHETIYATRRLMAKRRALDAARILLPLPIFILISHPR